jgi:hypothetical protein
MILARRWLGGYYALALLLQFDWPVQRKHPSEETNMKTARKLFATLALCLVLGAPVCAGDVNSPPVPAPPSKHTATSLRMADSKYNKTINASVGMDAATFAINLLISMLSIS